MRDAGGEIVAAVATLFDLTEHRQREEALAFLAEASIVLTETLDLQHTLTELVELAVPRLADWCTIDMLERGEIRNVGVAHVNPRPRAWPGACTSGDRPERRPRAGCRRR